MTQSNTDRAAPTPEEAGLPDTRLDNPKKARNVTNRDLAAIRQNPKLENKLKHYFEQEGSKSTDEQLIAKFKSIIANYALPG